MAELIFDTVFNTHICVEKKLTKRQKFKKTKRLQTGEQYAVVKKNYNGVRQMNPLSCVALIFSY